MGQLLKRHTCEQVYTSRVPLHLYLVTMTGIKRMSGRLTLRLFFLCLVFRVSYVEPGLGLIYRQVPKISLLHIHPSTLAASSTIQTYLLSSSGQQILLGT
jgi:hypothetical protein